MNYLARTRCTCLSQTTIFKKSHSAWSGAPWPHLDRDHTRCVVNPGERRRPGERHGSGVVCAPSFRSRGSSTPRHPQKPDRTDTPDAQRAGHRIRSGIPQLAGSLQHPSTELGRELSGRLYAFDTVVRETPSSAASDARVARRRALPRLFAVSSGLLNVRPCRQAWGW